MKKTEQERKPFTSKVECLIASVFGGSHHVQSINYLSNKSAEIYTMSESMATHDYNELTRLVILAHDECLRIVITSGKCGNLKLIVTDREGRNNYEKGHPALSTAIRRIREFNNKLRY